MKRIITIILMCLPFVAFGQTDYVDRLIKTDEYEIMANEITYKEPLEFNTLAEAFSFIGRANRTENVRITEDKELGIVSYKTLDVVRTVSVYGMIFEANYYNFRRFVRLRYKSENKDDCSRKEELRTLLLKVKEEYAPNSEIKKETNTVDFRGHLFADTFLDKYCPTQFEIVKFRKGDDDKDLSVNGKCPYFRILIRRR